LRIDNGKLIIILFFFNGDGKILACRDVACRVSTEKMQEKTKDYQD